MRFADLFERRVGDHHDHHVAEGDGLLDGTGLGERPETRREVLQVLGMARREEHRVPGLDEESTDGAAHASGPDHADLERRRRRRLGSRVQRPSGQGDDAEPACGTLEKVAAVVLSSVMAFHIPLRLEVYSPFRIDTHRPRYNASMQFPTDGLLDALNPPQREAVTAGDGPLLVLAGAGSGKTRVITSRIVWLLGTHDLHPRHVLAMTFTNKAAGEMARRVESLLAPVGTRAALITTFHAACVRILRQHGQAIGLAPHFTIYDEDDRLALVKQCMKEGELADRSFTPSAASHRISALKNQMLTVADALRDARGPWEQKLALVYSRYEKRLAETGGVDFDDLLLRTVQLLSSSAESLAWYRGLWRHVLVDEYQDTNRAQYRILRLLTSEHRNICVVGDPDQSIYRWRGAELRNILDFERDYPGTKVVRLEQNYRSTRRILSLASGVIANNVKRKDKTLWTENPEGEAARLYRGWDEYEEANFVAQTILTVRGDGIPWDGVAVFYRTNAQSRVIEDALRRARIPYVIVGGVRFYERREIKDTLAYLRLTLNPADDVAFRRAIGAPARGIGPTTLARLEEIRDREGRSLLAVAADAPADVRGKPRRV
ncbi:MAG: hypothetical protein DMD81_01635, partial [Candidatus Rokuibacteriota bacterium]